VYKITNSQVSNIMLVFVCA